MSLSSPDDGEDGQCQHNSPCCATNQSAQNASVYVCFLTPLTSVVGGLARCTPGEKRTLNDFVMHNNCIFLMAVSSGLQELHRQRQMR